MTTCVLITEKEYHKGKRVFDSVDGLEMLPAPADEPALAKEVRRRGASAVIVGVEPYTGELYSALAETAGGGKSLIARFGVGCDGIDLSQAQACEVLVANTPGVLDQSVAEAYTVADWRPGATHCD